MLLEQPLNRYSVNIGEGESPFIVVDNADPESPGRVKARCETGRDAAEIAHALNKQYNIQSQIAIKRWRHYEQ